MEKLNQPDLWLTTWDPSSMGAKRKSEIKEKVLASTVGGLCIKEDMSKLFDRIFDEKRCSEQKLPKAG